MCKEMGVAFSHHHSFSLYRIDSRTKTPIDNKPIRNQHENQIWFIHQLALGGDFHYFNILNSILLFFFFVFIYCYISNHIFKCSTFDDRNWISNEYEIFCLYNIMYSSHQRILTRELNHTIFSSALFIRPIYTIQCIHTLSTSLTLHLFSRQGFFFHSVNRSKPIEYLFILCYCHDFW